MNIGEQNDVERDLERLVVRPAPPGARERALAAAREARKNTALSPQLRIAAVVFSIVIVAALGIDLFIGGQEAARLATLLEGPGLSVSTGQENGLLWAELAADLGDTNRFQRMELALFRSWNRPDHRKALFEARDRLKGMIEHEDPDIIY
jgi:hypothetical protein